MPTPNQLNLNFNDGLLANGLNSPMRMELVYDLSNRWNKLTYLIDKISKYQQRQVTEVNGKIQKPLIGRSNVITLIASTTQVGSNLRVDFVDTSYDLFRVNNAVMDSARNQGRVVTTAPGFVIIEPTPKTPTLTSGTHFIAGNYIKDMFNVSPTRGSTSATGIYQDPIYDYNWTSVIRGTAELDRADQYQTYPKYKGGFWYTTVCEQLMTDYSKQLERRAWESWRSLDTDTSNKKYNGGLLWSIQDPLRGGIVRPMANNPTRNDVEEFFMAVKRQQVTGGQDGFITAMCGSDYLHNLQNQFLQTFVTTAGKWNTVGGAEVVGMDAVEWGFGGVRIKFIVCPYFDDNEYFPELSSLPGVVGTKESNSCVILDDSMYDSYPSSSKLPAMERIYFGQQEMHYNVLAGVAMDGGMGGNLPSVTFQGQSWSNVVSTRPAVTFEVFSASGVDCISNKMGYQFLTS